MDMDGLLKELDDARRQVGISKTELARMAGTQPASVRRLFSGNGHNPQVSTLASLAEALGHQIRFVPKSREELAAAAERATGAESAGEICAPSTVVHSRPSSPIRRGDS